MKKKALFILSEYGYWGEELLGPLTHLENKGYECTFVTNKGKRPHALPPSMDAGYIDPPLGMSVTSVETARKVRELDESTRLNHPVNLSTWFPERPYYSAADFLRQLENYYLAVKNAQQSLQEYHTLVLVGGSGPLVDMVNNQRLHDLILGFYKAGKPIGAVCYGVACLVFARDLNERKCIIEGKHITGHCIEYDYHDGTGFLNTNFVIGPPPYALEYMLRDAVGPKGQYHGNFGKQTSVIVDYPFISARSNQCSFEFGEKLVQVLEGGLTRYGW
jgi:putative intracellular protease/amidase